MAVGKKRETEEEEQKEEDKLIFGKIFFWTSANDPQTQTVDGNKIGNHLFLFLLPPPTSKKN